MKQFDWSEITRRYQEITQMEKELNDDVMPIIQNILRHSDTMSDEDALEYLDQQMDIIPNVKHKWVILRKLNHLYTYLNK